MIKKIIQLLGNLIKSFYKKEPKINLEDFLVDEAIVNPLFPIPDTIAPSPPKSRIVEWAEAIKDFEGFYIGSRSYRNNNPGNIKGRNGNFLVFSSYQQGLDYLCSYLIRACKGEHSAYPKGGETTLFEFQKIYSPSNDNNDPLRYATTVARKLEISVNDKIKTLL